MLLLLLHLRSSSRRRRWPPATWGQRRLLLLLLVGGIVVEVLGMLVKLLLLLLGRVELLLLLLLLTNLLVRRVVVTANRNIEKPLLVFYLKSQKKSLKLSPSHLLTNKWIRSAAQEQSQYARRTRKKKNTTSFPRKSPFFQANCVRSLYSSTHYCMPWALLPRLALPIVLSPPFSPRNEPLFSLSLSPSSPLAQITR